MELRICLTARLPQHAHGAIPGTFEHSGVQHTSLSSMPEIQPAHSWPQAHESRIVTDRRQRDARHRLLCLGLLQLNLCQFVSCGVQPHNATVGGMRKHSGPNRTLPRQRKLGLPKRQEGNSAFNGVVSSMCAPRHCAPLIFTSLRSPSYCPLGKKINRIAGFSHCLLHATSLCHYPFTEYRSKGWSVSLARVCHVVHAQDWLAAQNPPGLRID